MATHANSTTAPARPLLLLRGPDGRFARRAESTAPAHCDAGALASESASEGTELSGVEPPAVVEARATVAQTTKSGCGDISTPCDLDALVAPRGVVRVRFGEEQTPFALAEGDGLPHGGAKYEPDSLDAIRADIEALVAVDPVIVGVVDPKAHARFMRRALAAAVDHGVALLAALGLPQLVDDGFDRHDIVAVGAALDDAIAALDAADGDADAEPWLGWAGADRGGAVMGGTDDREEDEDDELSLGWSGLSQERLSACDDAEPTLGAPERHPYVSSMGDAYHEPADGSVRRIRNYASQATWAQGSRQDGEGESEPGYDLPCDTDELCGSVHDGREPDTCGEPSLGSPIGDGDQRHWCQGDHRDVETVNEGEGRKYDPNWTERYQPILYEHEMRELRSKAEAMKRCKRSGGNPQSSLPSGTVTYYAQPYRHSTGAWVVGEVRA